MCHFYVYVRCVYDRATYLVASRGAAPSRPTDLDLNKTVIIPSITSELLATNFVEGSNQDPLVRLESVVFFFHKTLLTFIVFEFCVSY